MRTFRLRALTAVAGAAVLTVLGAPHAGAQSDEPLDVLIAFDLTISMEDELRRAQESTAEAVTMLHQQYPNTRFAVGTLTDYPEPWAVVLDPTEAVAQVQSVISALEVDYGTEGAPEAFARVLYEARQGTIEWRPDAAKIVLLINDSVPLDDDVNDGIPDDDIVPDFDPNTGIDPGPDGTAGTTDDLDWQTELDRLRSEGVLLAVMYSGPDAGIPYWDYWTRRAGGSLRAWEPLGDFTQVLPETVVAAAQAADELALESSAPASAAVGIVAGIAVLTGAVLTAATLHSPTRRQRRLIRRHVRLQPAPDTAGTHTSTRPPDALSVPTVRLQPRPARVVHSVIDGSDPDAS